ncbi:hypothetical protein [uncultured Stenotrophomonas sp.]|uniref:hypothetical protein n=1 Tax=uncultured Stenotrophomonas sp. TaxID=165438 RepID=UPI0028E279B3|nr:hypothetical protein [uncultured Stenotrophomonas sp.]
MFVRTLMVGAVLGAAAAGCQRAAAEPVGDAVETQVKVEGVVEIFSGGHGLGYVTLDDGKCYDLALPASVLKNSQRWDTKRVLIKGSLQFRPRMDEMMRFDIKDRKIEGFGCSEDVIYVESIKML